MKNLIAVAVLALSSFASAAEWTIETNHATAGFTVKHLTVTSVTGTLGSVTGKLSYDEKNVDKSTLTASIEVKDLYTGNPKRDDHLKSPDFFDVAKHPTATFTSTKIAAGAPNKLKVEGNLTMHGVTKPVSFEAELSGEVDHPMIPNAKARAATASFTVNRDDFGLNWQSKATDSYFVVGREVKVDLNVELVKMGAPAAKAAPAKK
ncbi:MAG: YceI family protein [Myxococcus sp.]|nr:YceI family protein [Myxococcus sp.]